MSDTNYEKQLLLLGYIQQDRELFIRLNPILESKFFDPRLRKAVTFIKGYFEDYKSLPSASQVMAECSVSVPITAALATAERKYAEVELEKFCKQKAMEHAVYESVDLIKNENYGAVETLIKAAVTLSIQRSLGTDYFADPEARLLALKNQASMIPTKLAKLDEGLGGGLTRKEMIIFAAPSGVGKSITMLNVGFNLLSQGLNGVYITLELSEEVVAKRADSITTGISQLELLNNITKASIAVKQLKENAGYGSLKIKRMPESTTNANHIRAFLKEYELENGVVPDFIIVDYIDIMASAQLGVSPENVFIKDKYVCEELRSIANDFNAIMISASQLNRGAQELESLDQLGQGQIAGGISKINTTDNLVMIVQTAQMKARGELVFKFVKTRSSGGVGSYFTLRLSPITLKLDNLEDDVKPRSMQESINAMKHVAKSKKPPGGDLDAFQV